MSKRTPKNHKNSHNTLVVLCWHSKFFESNKRERIRFIPKGGTFRIETIRLIVRSSGLREAYTRTCPKWDKKKFHGMLMRRHDRMPSCMNLRRVLDLLEFKNLASQCFVGIQRCLGVSNSCPFLPWDLSMHPRHKFDFWTNVYALEHAHVVQIWIMHINALKTQIMHKNVQTNPEKSEKFTQHSCCSMLAREKLESNKRQWISFRHQRWDVPYRKPSCLLWEAPVSEKHIPKPAPNGTKFVPRHVDTAPW